MHDEVSTLVGAGEVEQQPRRGEGRLQGLLSVRHQQRRRAQGGGGPPAAAGPQQVQHGARPHRRPQVAQLEAGLAALAV
eukprot:1611867-Prymnesium_polylepis.1